MRIRLAVFAGLLLVFTLNSGNLFAAVIDKDNSDFPNINLVSNRNDIDGVNVNDNIVVRLDNGFDGNSTSDADKLNDDSLDNGNLNVEDNLGYDNDQLRDGSADLLARNLPTANVADSINLNL